MQTSILFSFTHSIGAPCIEVGTCISKSENYTCAQWSGAICRRPPLTTWPSTWLARRRGCATREARPISSPPLTPDLTRNLHSLLLRWRWRLKLWLYDNVHLYINFVSIMWDVILTCSMELEGELFRCLHVFGASFCSGVWVEDRPIMQFLGVYSLDLCLLANQYNYTPTMANPEPNLRINNETKFWYVSIWSPFV